MGVHFSGAFPGDYFLGEKIDRDTWGPARRKDVAEKFCRLGLCGPRLICVVYYDCINGRNRDGFGRIVSLGHMPGTVELVATCYAN